MICGVCYVVELLQYKPNTTQYHPEEAQLSTITQYSCMMNNLIYIQPTNLVVQAIPKDMFHINDKL